MTCVETIYLCSLTHLLGDPNGYIFLWRCSGTDNTYCCGDKFQSCCEESSINPFEVKPATELFRPPSSDESTASPTSIDAGISSITTSSTGTTTLNESSSTTEPPVENTGTSIPDQQGSNHQNLVIGLGVGTPLAIGIIAALIFLGIQMKRRDRSAAAHSKVLLEQQAVRGLGQPTELPTEQQPRELSG